MHSDIVLLLCIVAVYVVGVAQGLALERYDRPWHRLEKRRPEWF